MAPRKPVKPASKSVRKPLPAVASQNAPIATPMAISNGCCSHMPASHARRCTMVPLVFQPLFTRMFWAAAVCAFLTLFATDWLLHSHFLAAEYLATSNIWRTDGEIHPHLIFMIQVGTAISYTLLIFAISTPQKWLSSALSGLLAATPIALCALQAYIMLPFAEAKIPLTWALATLAQGSLVGLATCASLHLSRTPTATCNAPTPQPQPTIH